MPSLMYLMNSHNLLDRIVENIVLASAFATPILTLTELLLLPMFEYKHVSAGGIIQLIQRIAQYNIILILASNFSLLLLYNLLVATSTAFIMTVADWLKRKLDVCFLQHTII